MTNHSQLVEAAKKYVAAAEEARTAPAVTPQITANHESAYQAFRAALEASPEGERGEVAAGPIDWNLRRESDGSISIYRDHRYVGTTGNEPAATNPTPEGPKPTGTIFELDIFREKLERRANSVEGSTTTNVTEPYGEVQTGDRLAKELRDIAAELKTLIDNCMKQYAVPEGHVAVYLPVEVAERKSGKIITVTAGQRDKDEEAISRACWNATYQALSNGEGA